VRPPPALVVGPITRTDLVRYQGASGDMNPIHHDEPWAQAAGFKAPIALGMFTAGLVATWAVDWLGADNVRSCRSRFAARVFPGDTLTCAGDVVRRYAVDGEQRVDLELAATTQNGEVAVRGWMTFVVAA
jgi:acyl dehydratase